MTYRHPLASALLAIALGMGFGFAAIAAIDEALAIETPADDFGDEQE